MYPPRVMEQEQIFLNLKFNLTFATDTEMRDLMRRHFYFQQLVYADPDAEILALQSRADEISDYYNKLAYMRGLSEEINPLYNYDRTTEITETNTGENVTSGENDTLYSEFPMNTPSKKNVNDTVNKSATTGKSDTARNYKEHTFGNIGVQTLGDIVESSENKVYTLYLLKQRFIMEFDDLFMLTI